jgi:ADP-ribosylglycohydrolase
MRAPILGLLERDPQVLDRLVEVSTRATHDDAVTVEAASVLARIARHTADGATNQVLLTDLEEGLLSPCWTPWVASIRDGLRADLTPAQWAQARGLGLGVTGWVLHTLPAVLYTFLRYRGDFARAVQSVILLGGDADTTGALVGALAGLDKGEPSMPRLWVDRIIDWPLSVSSLRRLAADLERATETRRPWWEAALMPARNVFLLTIVLAVGVRRLLPPW